MSRAVSQLLDVPQSRPEDSRPKSQPSHRAASSSRVRQSARPSPQIVRVNGRIQLFLVSSNRLLREALSRVLRTKDDIYVAGVSLCTEAIFDEVLAKSADVILLDGCPAEMGGRALVSGLIKLLPNVKIILLGMDECEALFLRSVREGVAGYLLQDASAADVISAVRAVARNEAVCPPRLCWTIFQQMARQACGLPSVRIRVQLGLTRRQQQLLPLIAQGMTNKEIASGLNLSEQTVKNHIHRMLQRVGANDRLSVVELCRNQGHLL